MASYLLIDEIRTRLKSELDNWYLEHPINDNEFQRGPPNINIGQLPPKSGSMPTGATGQKNSDSEFPFILIRPLENTFSSDTPSQQVFNIAIICGIHSSESFEKYEAGIEEVLNITDRISLLIKKYQFWGHQRFYHNDDIKCVFGLPKSIDPYEAGIQADAPYFASVVLTSFYREIDIPKIETLNFI